MNYIGYFKSLFKNAYKVKITTPTQGEDTEIILSSAPFNTTMNTDGNLLYKTIKTQGATVELIQSDREYYKDFYSPNIFHTKVELFLLNEETSTETLAWTGWCTPCLYTQPYAYVHETLALEFVSPLATLEYFKYKDSSVLSIRKVIDKILQKAQGVNRFCFTTCLKLSKSISSSIIDILSVNEQNFLDKDDPEANWSYKEVLDEICNYLSVTAFEVFDENGTTVYFVDYDAIKNGINTYWVYNVGSTAQPTIATVKSEHLISAQDYMSNETSLSLSEVYNKITVTVENNEIESEGKEVFEADDLVPYIDRELTEAEKEEYINYFKDTYPTKDVQFQDIKDGILNLLINSKEDSKTITKWIWMKYYENPKVQTWWYEYPPNAKGSNVPNLYGKLSNLEENADFPLKTYYYTKNYNGCILTKQAEKDFVLDNNIQTIVPSVGLTDILQIGCHRENVIENIQHADWTDFVDYNWYMNHNGNYFELVDSKQKVHIEAKYPIQPVFRYTTKLDYDNDGKDKWIIINFTGLYSNKNTRPFYYTGFDDKDDMDAQNAFITCSLKVGDKYLKGDWSRPTEADKNKDDWFVLQHICGEFAFVNQNNTVYNCNCRYRDEDWTTTRPTLYEYYRPNQSPVNSNIKPFQSKIRLYWQKEDDYLGKDLKLQSNIRWEWGLEESEGVAFKLPSDAKFGDDIEFTIFMPHSIAPNNESDYVFIKNLKIKIEEPDADFAKDGPDEDTEYSLTVDDDYSIKLDEQNLKISSYDGKKPSYNYVSIEGGSYVDTIRNEAFDNDEEISQTTVLGLPYTGDLRPEWWKVWKIYKQYKEPRVELETVLKKDVSDKLYSLLRNNIDGGIDMIVDTMDIDFYNDKCKIKLIEKV